MGDQLSAPIHREASVLRRSLRRTSNSAPDLERLAHEPRQVLVIFLGQGHESLGQISLAPARQMPALSRSRTSAFVSSSRMSSFFQNPTLRTSWRMRSTISKRR